MQATENHRKDAKREREQQFGQNNHLLHWALHQLSSQFFLGQNIKNPTIYHPQKKNKLAQTSSHDAAQVYTQKKTGKNTKQKQQHIKNSQNSLLLFFTLIINYQVLSSVKLTKHLFSLHTKYESIILQVEVSLGHFNKQGMGM